MLTNRTLRGKTLLITGVAAFGGIDIPARRLACPSSSKAGNFFIDDAVLAEQGTTDLSPYAVVRGAADFLPDFFID
jgi:hypothetical protein